MVHPLNELRQAREAGLEKARDPLLAFVTRAELEEALEPIRAALEVSEPATVVYALDEIDEESQVGPDRETEKGRHPAEADPEGLELVEKIHERKSRAKRKPENEDPLGLVPDPEED